MSDPAAFFPSPEGAPIVLIDMDNTIVDMDAFVLARLAEKLPDLDISPAAATHFFIHERYPVEHEQIIYDILNLPTLFRDLEPIEGAIQALHEMLDERIDVRICTAPSLYNVTCASDKIFWVGEHLERDFQRRTIISKDKTAIRGRLLIDDKPNITGALVPEWQQVFVTQPYNSALPGPRIDKWGDWRSVILPLLG